jgi:helicase
MKIASLPVPAPLIGYCEEKGITDLYPPQAACVDEGIFSGKSLLVAIPTASGKTLVAELAMHAQIANGGKCLYIVPLRALAGEKFREFSGKGVKVGISTGDLDRRDEFLGANDIIIATSEKVDSLLRNRTPWLREVTLLVVDEVHLIASPDRGPTLEMVITKLRYRIPNLQVIALSATIGNPKKLADWLGAGLVTSEWRPVDLRQGVFYRGKIHFHQSEREVAEPSKTEDLNLCIDTIEEGGQCLVFVNSRRNAEGFAKRAAAAFKKRVKSPILEEYAARILESATTDQEKVLAACIATGSAFHHAGLRREFRELIEEGFLKGEIRCISSTPTLAAGLNLPARRVIIRDLLRFSGAEGMAPIPVGEYHQMAGRAGRPHLDPYGEAVMIAKNEQSIEELFERYIDAPAEPVISQCTRSGALCSHLLSLIATGFAADREALSRFLVQTFYGFTHASTKALDKIVDQSLEFLTETEMITEIGDLLQATEYGALVSRLYIDPLSAEAISGAMLEADSYSDRALLQVVCSTSDMPALYLKSKDLQYLEKFLYEHGDDLWQQVPWEDREQFYRSVKTAMLLGDYTDEVPEAIICERYDVGPGDLYAAVTNVTWLIHAAGRLASMFREDLAPALRELEICTAQGIRRELLPLVRLKGIGRVRARRLFNNGITDPAALQEAGFDRVSAILGSGVAKSLFSQFDEKQTKERKNDYQGSEQVKKVQTSLFGFGGCDE